MSTNVVQLFPKKKEPASERVTMPSIYGVIHNIVDWATEEGIDTSTPDFQYMCADFLQQLQMVAYREAA